jgi:hypothetical protein
VELNQKYKDQGLQIVMVSPEPAGDVIKVMGKGPHPATILTDADKVHDQFHVSSLPHVFFFDRQGMLAFRFEGYSDQAMQDLAEAVDKGVRVPPAL